MTMIVESGDTPQDVPLASAFEIISTITKIHSELVTKCWYQLPWEDVSKWDTAFRFPEFDCNDWQFWGCEAEPVILAVRTSPTLIMGFDLAESDRSVEDVISEAQAVIRQATEVSA